MIFDDSMLKVRSMKLIVTVAMKQWFISKRKTNVINQRGWYALMKNLIRQQTFNYIQCLSLRMVRSPTIYVERRRFRPEEQSKF